MHVLGFAPPMQGFDGEWNTIRLGRKWANLVVPGETVLLMDNPKFKIFGVARVKRVIVGRVAEVLPIHAQHNHNQKHNPEGAAERAVAAMRRRYGPHKVSDTSWVSVIYVERINETQGSFSLGRMEDPKE